MLTGRKIKLCCCCCCGQGKETGETLGRGYWTNEAGTCQETVRFPNSSYIIITVIAINTIHYLFHV
jgi:hypothetical protein